MREVLIAPRSPWQNPYVERLIGSIRRECLDHAIVFDALHLKRLPGAYFSYYHTARTHLALNKQCPEPRAVKLPEQGKVIAFPHVGGLHHEYRRAAQKPTAKVPILVNHARLLAYRDCECC